MNFHFLSFVIEVKMQNAQIFLIGLNTKIILMLAVSNLIMALISILVGSQLNYSESSCLFITAEPPEQQFVTISVITVSLDYIK